jgi:hypothetical protein
MKLQYLGDSKDSFTWDYHDFLVTELNYPLLNIALMMTPDDGSNEGKSHPSLFPAREEIIHFCHHLRDSRAVHAIKTLPEKTNAIYQVEFHRELEHINTNKRAEYFSGINTVSEQVFFLDPDNGFEPEKSINEKHIGYADLNHILEQLPDTSVVSVFQHHRRKAFPDDFARIKTRLLSGHATAIYWHAVMFVAISRNENVIKKVMGANQKYAAINPVNIIAW